MKLASRKQIASLIFRSDPFFGRSSNSVRHSHPVWMLATRRHALFEAGRTSPDLGTRLARLKEVYERQSNQSTEIENSGKSYAWIIISTGVQAMVAMIAMVAAMLFVIFLLVSNLTVGETTDVPAEVTQE